jgi:hypothetical protein
MIQKGSTDTRPPKTRAKAIRLVATDHLCEKLLPTLRGGGGCTVCVILSKPLYNQGVHSIPRAPDGADATPLEAGGATDTPVKEDDKPVKCVMLPLLPRASTSVGAVCCVRTYIYCLRFLENRGVYARPPPDYKRLDTYCCRRR